MSISKQNLNSIWQKVICSWPCTFHLAILTEIWYLVYFIQGSIFLDTLYTQQTATRTAQNQNKESTWICKSIGKTTKKSNRYMKQTRLYIQCAQFPIFPHRDTLSYQTQHFRVQIVFWFDKNTIFCRGIDAIYL